jgi:hypothetical protein
MAQQGAVWLSRVLRGSVERCSVAQLRMRHGSVDRVQRGSVNSAPDFCGMAAVCLIPSPGIPLPRKTSAGRQAQMICSVQEAVFWSQCREPRSQNYKLRPPHQHLSISKKLEEEKTLSLKEFL